MRGPRFSDPEEPLWINSSICARQGKDCGCVQAQWSPCHQLQNVMVCGRQRNIKARGWVKKKGLTSWVLVDILTLIKQTPEEDRVTIRTSTVDCLLDAHSYSVKLMTTIVTSDCLDETNYNIWCSNNFGRAGKCTCLQPKKKCQLHPQPLLSLPQRICNSANSLSWHQALLKCFRYSKLSLNRTWRD